MTATLKWLSRPEKHDYQAAQDYLSLIMSPKRAAEVRRMLAVADALAHRQAMDILRASQLAYWIDENTDIPCLLV
mgnify:CR=1 FL=1